MSRPDDIALPSADVVSEPLHVAMASCPIGRERADRAADPRKRSVRMAEDDPAHAIPEAT